MNWGEARDIADLIVIAWGFISGGLVLYLRGSFATRAEMAAMRHELSAFALELTRVTGLISLLEERLAGFGKLLERAEREIALHDDFLRNRRAVG